MNVKELISELQKHPEHTEVFIDERLTDFKYGLLNGVSKKNIAMSEDPDGEPLAHEDVIILSED